MVMVDGPLAGCDASVISRPAWTITVSAAAGAPASRRKSKASKRAIISLPLTAADFDRATDADGARQAELASDHQLARVVMLPDGTGYLVNDDLTPLSADETYQLWALVGDRSDPRVISAGVLGSDPTGASFKLEGPVTGFALTVEHAGGVPVSANDPIAVADLA